MAAMIIWTELPLSICYLAALVIWLAMLVDSWRPGRMTIPLWSIFIVLFVFFALVPTAGHLLVKPFKIPTNAMKPTLVGMVGTPSEKQAPAGMTRLIHKIGRGRDYIDVVSAEDDRIEGIEEQKWFSSTRSKIRGEHQTFLVHAPPEILRHDFNVTRGRSYRAGEVIARGAVDGGDRIFVDTASYRFHPPRRGDLVVFRTDGISGIAPGSGPVFYVKRLAGLPGDTLRIEPPNLYVNGKLAQGAGFERVMKAADGYRGYAPGREYLRSSTDEFHVPEGSYFMLGDNSYNSFDSRYWGCVPAANIVGRVARIYFPLYRAGIPR